MTFVATTSSLNLAKRLSNMNITNSNLLDVIAKTPRDQFIDNALTHKAYENTALPIGSGQTISQPYIVARMTELLLEYQPQSVLEIGTGSGYQTAILAQLFPQVYTIERIKDLQIQARQRLKKLNLHNISFKYGDGWKGWSNRAPFDAIIVTAAATEIPTDLLNQLTDGSILIIPVGENNQQLLKVTCQQGKFTSQAIETVKFVPLIKGDLT